MTKIEANKGGAEPSEKRQQEILASFSRQGFLRSMGARIVALSAGKCVIELPFSDNVSQQHGLFHGGAIGAVADTAGGYAAMAAMDEGVEALTVEYKINFLRPAMGDAIIATGKVLKVGRSVAVTRVDVHVRQEENIVLCAALQQSIMAAPPGGQR